VQNLTRSAPGRAAARADGERSRERILDAAEQLRAKHGFSGTGIAAISRESGLPASSIYWFFSSKQDLTAAVIERAADRWFEAFGSGADDSAGDIDFRQFVIRALAQSGSRLPDFARLQILLALERGEADPAMRERFQDVLGRGYQLLAGVLARSLEARGMAEPAALAREIAPLVLALANGALINLDIDPEGIALESFAEDLEAAVVAIAERRAGRSR
jgi:AcrR family transcriptional regulator